MSRHGVKYFFIADTHFSHEAIIRYCGRPFKDAKEMDAVLIKNWNSVVRRNDVIFMLGDFALCGKERLIEVGNQLNGRKTIVLGNHDTASVKTYYEAGFEHVSKYPILFNSFLLLSHEPQFVTEGGVFGNIYGHVHNGENYRDYTENTYCVSAERIYYTPIELGDMVPKMRGYAYETP